MGQIKIAGVAPSRADLRRAQVLEAAAKCFNREGFHGASMADVASEASMSVGQIYRYFENKEGVIAALVEQSLAERALRMAEVRASGGDLVEQMVELARYNAEKVGEHERAALTLEFLAEAARNPRIAEIVCAIDTAVRGQIKDMAMAAGMADDENLTSRLNLIAMLIDGWAMRAVKDPAANKEHYLDTLRPLFAMLLACCAENGR